jgi:hypothetical protein
LTEATLDRTDALDWVRKDKVCWELAPLREVVKGHGIQQTGYALRLYGRFDPAAQVDDDVVARAIFERLRALAQDALSVVPGHTIIQVQPLGRTVLPAESPPAVEVELTVLASPADPDDPQSSEEARRQITKLEGQLRSMGLKKRR